MKHTGLYRWTPPEAWSTVPRAWRYALGAVCLSLSLLLAVWLVVGGYGARRARATFRPVTFTEVTRTAGISFSHTHGGCGKKYMPETMGSGCAFLDFDGDGWLDLLLLNGRPLASGGGDGAMRSRGAAGPIPQRSATSTPTAVLYRNNGNGTFTDATRGSGLDVPLYAMGCCVGDYDNDGRSDVYITCALEPSRLFHNETRAGGPARFRDVTAAAGTGNEGKWGASCAWLDYDRDGWLDLFVGNYVRYTLAQDQFCTMLPGRKSYCPPMVYDGDTCILYHNNRDGTFTDVTRAAGVEKPGAKALGVVVFDYDNDGWPDVAVANDLTANFLYRNRSNGAFEEVGEETGFAYQEGGTPKAGMGIDAADYRNDGSAGILISNFAKEGLSLYDCARPFSFEEIAAHAGLREPSMPFVGFGTFFFDYDNDGWKDCFVANGHVYDEIQALEPDITYGERNLLFHNDGSGVFSEVGMRCGKPFTYQRVSRGAACGDYDNDGDLDILLTNNNARAELLRNDGGNSDHALQIQLVGTTTNRDGIGSVARVTAGRATQRDWVRSGSSYLSQSMLRLHFGLGAAQQAEVVEVRWSSGRVERLHRLPAGYLYIIQEGAGIIERRALRAASRSAPGK